MEIISLWKRSGSRFRRQKAALALLTAAGLAAALLLFLPWEALAQNDPSGPSDLSARVVDSGIQLDWEAPQADAGAVTGYRILRRRPDEGEGRLTQLVRDTGSTATAYLDASATEQGVRYIYRVRALRGEEKSKFSNKAEATYPAPTPTPTATPEPTPTATPEPTPTATPGPSSPRQEPRTTDATLSSLTVAPKDVIGFSADRTGYEVGVDSGVSQATVTAEPADSGASAVITPSDADGNVSGHQVDLSAGMNAVTITVTAQDGLTTTEYTVSINRGVDDPRGWNAGADLDGLRPDNHNPRGIWSDGDTMWVVDFRLGDDKIYAYNLSDGERDSDKDFDTLDDAGNNSPYGIWSNDTTMWVSDIADAKLYAYRMSDGSRDSDKDFDTVARPGYNHPTGIWSNGTTMWVANGSENKIYAYNLSDGERDSDKDFDTLDDAGNTSPTGIWSDGVHMWVADNSDYKIYAYWMSDGSRDVTRDFNRLGAAGNVGTIGIWSDGTTMWVSDWIKKKLYAYNMSLPTTPLSPDATLGSLTVAPKDIIGFLARRYYYEVGVDSGVSQATVVAELAHSDASAVITPADADGNLPGHQVDLSAGRNLVTIKVTAQDWSTEVYKVSINRGVDDFAGWNAGADLDGLDPDNDKPRGIWSDGTTMWVSENDFDDKLFAYNLSDGSRDAEKDFNTLAGGNDNPTAFWSDGDTMWVADLTNAKLFAYNMSDRQHDAAKDYPYFNQDFLPSGMWSDGATMWVATSFHGDILAHDMSFPNYYWQRDAGKDFDTLDDAGIDSPMGIWSDGVHMWVLDSRDDKIYAFNMRAPADATLDSLTVAPKDIIGFSADRASYEVGVDSGVSQATVAAVPNYSGASAVITPADADGNVSGHQVDLSAGRNAVTITVTAQDGVTIQEYTVSINRGVDDPKGWNAGADLDGLIAAGNLNPAGVWSNGTTMWVLNTTDDKIYAYNMSDGARDSAKDFNTLTAAGNTTSTSIWSNGTTMWVTDSVYDKIYAYRMSDRQRDADKDFDTLVAGSSYSPRGLWSNGTTMWVTDSVYDKIYAYRMSDRQRDSAKDFNTLDAAGNNSPLGLWSDGTTMWVLDSFNRKIYAYRMFDRERDSDKDFDTLAKAGYNNPIGIWSDGTTMWVSDWNDGKLYAYNMPLDATLDSLTVAPKDIIGFLAGRRSYEVGVDSGVSQATVSAVPAHSGASAVITPADADGGTPGHQVDLSAGRNTVTITVTAEDGVTTENYRVRINRGVDDPKGWNAGADLDGLIAAGNLRPYGVWSDGTTMWVGDLEDDKIYAYRMSDRQRDFAKDFDTLDDAGNNFPTGIWSDGTTMWVANIIDSKLYAYNMSDRQRDFAKDFDTLDDAGNNFPTGIWSNGTTMWVADDIDSKLYAYRMSDRQRDADKDFDTLDDAGNDIPTGIWSNGPTMWVTDITDGKLYAYRMSDRERDADKDFDTLGAAGNNSPYGVWSDGATMWVAESVYEKVYSFNVPPSAAGEGKLLLSLTALNLDEDGGGGRYGVRLNKQPTADVTVSLSQSASGVAHPGPTELTFTDSNWQINQWVRVTPVADSDRLNDAVTLTHWAASADASFDGAVAWLFVNVDERSPRDHHLHQIAPRHDLELGHQDLPEEAMQITVGRPFHQTIEVVAEGNRWTPSGIWGDPVTDRVWVVDPIHFGIHPLKLSALREGRIERHVAPDTTTFDYRFNYDCHFSGSVVPGIGNPGLTVIWGDEDTIWVANTERVGLDAYRRDGSYLGDRCHVDNVTAWSSGSPPEATTAEARFKTPFTRNPAVDYVLRAGNARLVGVTFLGVWSDGATMWLSLTSGRIVALDLAGGGFAESSEFGQFPAYGLWSDGTTMWTASPGWLRAYHLGTYQRRAEFDVKLRSHSMPPADIWSDGETVWVANRTGYLDAYELPPRPYAPGNSSQEPRSDEPEALTASFSAVPEAHDGRNEFSLRIAFSEDVRSAPAGLLDGSLDELQVFGATLLEAVRAEGRQDLWELTLVPDGRGPVSLLLSPGEGCKGADALCTVDGRPLSGFRALQIPGPQGKSVELQTPLEPGHGPPPAPAQPSGVVIFAGGVDLSWPAATGAEAYEVQTWRGGGWLDLPGDGVEIAFYGAGAIISGLDPQSSLWFRLRAANAEGVSAWSPMLLMNATSEYELGRRDRPANLPATGAPLIQGTPEPGRTLFAETSSIEDPNGLEQVRFGYQWTADDGGGETEIAGATHLTYVVAAADAGRTLRVRVSFVDRHGYAESLTSAAVAVAAAPDAVQQRTANRPAAGVPTISGAPQVDETLTAEISAITDADGLEDAVFEYQWLLNDGTADTDIAGATDSNYTVAAADEGKMIKVRVSFTDDAGNEESLTSPATEEVDFAMD